MKLASVNEALDHRIVGGSEYHWNCYGTNVRFLDYESDHAHASAVFDTSTHEVYEITVNDKTDYSNDSDSHRPYRWLNPEHKDKYLAECSKKNIKSDVAWDDIRWVDLEVEEDFLEKAHAVFNNLSFDKRVKVPVDLDDDLMLHLCLEAHKRDITLNEMVELLLQQVIDKNSTEKNSS